MTIMKELIIRRRREIKIDRSGGEKKSRERGNKR